MANQYPLRYDGERIGVIYTGEGLERKLADNYVIVFDSHFSIDRLLDVEDDELILVNGKAIPFKEFRGDYMGEAAIFPNQQTLRKHLTGW